MIHIRLVTALPELEQVKTMWRAASATLGFFPEGAFQEYMHRKWIIGAFNAESECIGYLAFRRSKGNAAIVHLCVHPSARGRGTSRALFHKLRELTTGCRGAILRCRTDYDANALWPRLGFAPVAESQGRSIDGKMLKTWWFDYGEPTLFAPVDDERSVAVVDANVFFDLQDPPTKKNSEAKALTADWLQEYLQLAVTDEIYGEIDRNPAKAERDRRRAFVSSLLTLQHDHALAAVTEAELRDVIPPDGSESTESDRRQLAKAIAGKADAFVTRDGRLLRLNSVIRRRWGINVVRPMQVVVKTDQLERAAKYEPVRLSGTLLASRLIKADDIATLSQTFQNFPAREPLSNFTTVLRKALAAPGQYESRLITNAEGQLLALEIVEHSGRERDLQLLRVCPGPISPTLIRHMVWRQVTEAAKGEQVIVRCTDTYPQTATAAALSESGFVPTREGWGKVLLRRVLSPDAVAAQLDALGGEQLWISEVAAAVEKSLPLRTPTSDAVVEKYLWPVRIRDAAIPTYLVPIEPRWALHLFDERLAEQTLFGSEPSLALNVHNVYYRSARPGVLTAPARVMWYVSQRDQYAGSGHVRAVSTIDEVIVGPAKELYKRFKRLGVYEWADISERWSDPQTPIMAFTFSGTELLPRPVSWRTLQAVLEQECGSKSQLQSPLQVTSPCFERLYQLGTA